MEAAGISTITLSSIADLTSAVSVPRLAAIEHPLVHILGHPTGRFVGRREGLSPDMNDLFEAAAEQFENPRWKAAALFRAGRYQYPGNAWATVERPDSGVVYIIDKPVAPQSLILAGHVAPPTGVDNNIAITTMNDVIGGQVVSSASAAFYYYYDANSDGIANDSGSGWYKAGDGTPTNNLAPWVLSWDSSGLPVGQYLLKVIASDTQGNVVDSSTLPSPLIQVGTPD